MIKSKINAQKKLKNKQKKKGVKRELSLMASNLICVYINLKVLLFTIIYIKKNSCSSKRERKRNSMEFKVLRKVYHF